MFHLLWMVDDGTEDGRGLLGNCQRILNTNNLRGRCSITLSDREVIIDQQGIIVTTKFPFLVYNKRFDK